MSYVLIRADEVIREDVKPLVFLGGNCKGRDWRLDFVKRFQGADLTFINPRREKFANPEVDMVTHVNQVLWEREAIDKCDIAVFWLGDGLANQASRVEIGYALGIGKAVLIGSEDGFVGMEHLTAFSGLVLSSSLEGLMNRLASLLSGFHSA